jgi:hypothetical protein
VESHRFAPALERDYFAVGIEGVRGETDYELAELHVVPRALPVGLYAEDGTAIE